MPSAPKQKSYTGIVATQSDDVKYRQKYKELKTKVLEIEEDNTKLSVKILKSKKAIQRLRIERAILYDRLQSTVAPTNPYALSSAAHLASLASSSSAASTSSNPNAPPSILAPPSYPLADPAAPELFLRQLDAQKLAALDQPGAAASHVEYGERPVDGIAGEGDAAKEHRALMAAGGPVNGQANGGGGNAVQAAMQAAADAAAAAAGSSGDVAASSAAVPQAVELAQAQAQAQQMQVDEA